MQVRILVLVSVLLLPSFAFGHAELKAASIEDGVTLTTVPAEISLTFSEAAELSFSTFKVYRIPDGTGDSGSASEGQHDLASQDGGGAGSSHGEDKTHGALDSAAQHLMGDVIGDTDDIDVRADMGVTPSSGQTEKVTLALKSNLVPGAYAVMWKALSVDSHDIEGFLTFIYEPKL